MQELPILYKKAKTEATREWRIWAENGTIFTEWGQMGGAKQIATEHCKGKNIGRNNETTPQSQAEAQALSKWKKQKDRGYRETLEETEERVLLPMLANNKAIKRGDKIPFQFPVDIQPKLDGCLHGSVKVECGDGISRTMEEIVEGKLDVTVKSYNTLTDMVQFNQITAYMKDFNMEEAKWFLLILDDGTELKITGNHPIYLPDLKCWRRVDELEGTETVLLSTKT